LLEPIPALSFIVIAESRAAQPALGGGVPTGASRIGDTRGTEISPDRDTTAPQRDVAGLCGSLPTVLPGVAATPGQNPGFSRNEGEIWTETDCLLEGNGFELPVRGRGQPDCRLFVQPASVSSRAHSGGLDIGRRAVQSLVVRTQADRLILHVATVCAEDVADIGAAGQVTHTEP